MGINEKQEDAAAAIVADRLGGTYTRRDVKGAQSTHYFDVHFSDGLVALEVTRCLNPKEQAQFNAPSPNIEGLDYQWAVSVTSDVKVKRLGDLAPLLLSLESGGIPHYALSDHADPDLFRRGIRDVYRLSGTAGPLVLTPATESRSYHSNDLASVATEKAALEDNKKKLKNANGSQKDLFVWVHFSAGGAATALVDNALPHLFPDLPSEVDRVWLAGNWETSRVISFDIGEGWVEHEGISTWPT